MWPPPACWLWRWCGLSPGLSRRSGSRVSPLIWVATAIVLVLWLVGLLLRIGQWVNLLLVVAAVLLVVQLINERNRPPAD